MKRIQQWLACALITGGSSLALAESVTELYSSSPLAETPIPSACSQCPSAIRTGNTVFGMNTAWSTDDNKSGDEAFGLRRFPSILKSIIWGRKTALAPRPARASTLMPQLKAIFSSEGIPPELVWIAEVESRFDPSAVSRSGARGLFQFMPDTARRFGLISDAGDQRTDPETSARAAARYLSVLYKRFQDWPLALAAYNAGEGRVDRLLRKHNADSFDEIAVHLPAETQEYIPKIMTTLILRENTFLGALPPPNLSPTWN